MTETTAKPGMIRYKEGHTKDTFKYGYLEDIPYNASVSVRNIIKGLESSDKNIELENKSLKEELNKQKIKQEAQDEVIKKLIDQVNKIEMKYYEALKGVITR